MTDTPPATDRLHLAHYHTVLQTCRRWHISLKTLLLLLRIARRGEKGLNTRKIDFDERRALRQNRPWEHHGAFLCSTKGPKARGADAWRCYTAPPEFLRHLCPLPDADCPPFGPAQAGVMKHRLHALLGTGLSACHISTLLHAAGSGGLLRSDMDALPWGRSVGLRGGGMTATLNDLLRLGALLTEPAPNGHLRLHTVPAVTHWFLDPTVPWPRLPRQPELPVSTLNLH